MPKICLNSTLVCNTLYNKVDLTFKIAKFALLKFIQTKTKQHSNPTERLPGLSAPTSLEASCDPQVKLELIGMVKTE